MTGRTLALFPRRTPRGACAGLPGQIHRRIATEESPGDYLKAGRVDGHDGPVFRAWIVGNAHGVPHYDFLVVEGAVGGSPARQAIAAAALVGVVAARVDFAGLIGSDPDVRIEERGPFADPVARLGHS